MTLLQICPWPVAELPIRFPSYLLFLSYLSVLLASLLSSFLINNYAAMSGRSAEVAFWSATKHLIQKAMPEAPDAETQRAYMLVLEHAEERLAYHLTATKPNAQRPPHSPAPKSA